MNILWHDSAVFELEEAALYYGGVDDELGLSFIAEAEVAVAQIKARPKMSRKFDGEARKALRIIAVMHLPLRFTIRFEMRR
jgi:hypothetical protein